MGTHACVPLQRIAGEMKAALPIAARRLKTSYTIGLKPYSRLHDSPQAAFTYQPPRKGLKKPSSPRWLGSRACVTTGLFTTFISPRPPFGRSTHFVLLSRFRGNDERTLIQSSPSHQNACLLAVAALITPLYPAVALRQIRRVWSASDEKLRMPLSQKRNG